MLSYLLKDNNYCGEKFFSYKLLKEMLTILYGYISWMSRMELISIRHAAEF